MTAMSVHTYTQGVYVLPTEDAVPFMANPTGDATISGVEKRIVFFLQDDTAHKVLLQKN